MKKRGIIALAITVPIAFVLHSFFVVALLPIGTFHNSSITDHSRFFRDCVEANPSLITKPLTELSMLGSHDALSNDINFFSAPNSSEDNIFVNNWFLYSFGRGVVTRFAKAQQHNIYDQLKAGVRYIDARITYVNGKYYTSHGLISNTLEHNLNLILKFLDENKGEFILFNINNYYPSTSSFNELSTYIDSIKYNNKCLTDYVNYSTSVTNFSELNYQTITDNGTKAGVVLFTDQNNAPSPWNQFYFSKIRAKHHNMASASDINVSIRKEADYCKNLSPNVLKINQTQQSATEKEIWSTFVNWSLLHQAKIHNAELLDHPDIDYIVDVIPIYQADYVTSDYKNFNNRITLKLMTRNKNL